GIWTRGFAGGIPWRRRARQALWRRSAARDGRSLALPTGQRRPVQAEKSLNERNALAPRRRNADQVVGRTVAALSSFTVFARSSRTNRSNCSTLIGCGWTPSFASLS